MLEKLFRLIRILLNSIAFSSFKSALNKSIICKVLPAAWASPLKKESKSKGAMAYIRL